MAKSKQVRYPIHKNGKQCGYEKLEDGSVQVAPAYSGPMSNAVGEQLALEELLRVMTEQCHKLLVPIHKTQRHFWDSIKEDYGLDYDKYLWSYERTTGIVIKKLKESEAKKAR